LGFDPGVNDARISADGNGATEEASRTMRRTVSRLIRCQSGATAIEYGLIVGLIFLVIIASVSMVATDITNMFNTVSNAVTGNM
jgi:pilus assembly protein Flp/PilA